MAANGGTSCLPTGARLRGAACLHQVPALSLGSRATRSCRAGRTPHRCRLLAYMYQTHSATFRQQCLQVSGRQRRSVCIAERRQRTEVGLKCWKGPDARSILQAAAMIYAAACAASPAAVAAVLPATQQMTAALPGGLGDSAFREGVASGFLLILFSELGDKTFFIALLLSLNKPKTAVFTGTFGALAIMTVISVALGQIIHRADELLPFTSPFPLDDVLAAALLIFFGLKTLKEASAGGADEERSEALEDVNRLGAGTAGLVLSTFALVFAAEWGDKSFLATIALAAASSPAGVVAGAVAGHGAATGIAVLGGSVLGELVSEQVVQYVGGSLFLLFAAVTVLDIVRGVNIA